MAYHVYFIQERKTKGSGPAAFKTGIACDVARRLKELQTGNPRKLKVRAAIQVADREEAYAMEQCLHRLADKRFKHVRGEWFRLYGQLNTIMHQAAKMAHIDDYRMVKVPDVEKQQAKQIKRLEAEVERLQGLLAEQQPS